jgi:hypothetical protein
MEIVIPSRRRADKIVGHTLRLFPDALVCIEDSEASDYEMVGCRLLLHPPLSGLPAILNWIIGCSEIPGDKLAIVDDDLMYMQAIIHAKPRRIDDPGDVRAIVENCRYMAEGFGARLWGFSVNRRPDSNYAYKPFSLAARISSFRGISDRSMRYDESFLRHDDADLSLQRLLTDRIVFRDDRFNFVFRPVYKTTGGSSDDYDVKSQQQEESQLKRKWGKYAFFVKSPHHWHETRINVQR